MRHHINQCNYCDKLLSAINTKNYCSEKKDDVDSIGSNAFYFSTNSLNSGVHTSRFSIRSIDNGYQEYEIDGKSNVLKSDNILILNQGSRFESFLDQESNAEGLTIAFNPNFVNSYMYSVNNTSQHILDNPNDKPEASLSFTTRSFTKNKSLKAIFETVVNKMKQGEEDSMHYQQIFLHLLDELILVREDIRNKLSHIKAMKKSTREELYFRLCTAKDFIDSNLHLQLSLAYISQESCLSPFYFLRTFSDFFNRTPYQYIKSERLKKAKFKIENSSADLEQIMTEVGFENKRTFQRSFQKEFGMTAYQYMKSQRN